MSEYIDTLDPWPNGKPLPPKAITILFDPDTNKEYRIETARLGGNAGASTNYFKEVYTAKASGAQTITSADVPGLDTAVLIASVGVRGVDAQGTVTLDGVSSDNYFLSQGVLTIKTDADIDQDDVLEINFITAGQLAAAGLSATQLAQLLVAGSGISINPTPDGKLLITATLVTAPVVAPRAPTDGQVDDVADTFSFLPNSSYPAAAQYRVVGRPGITGAEQLDATNSYTNGNRIVVKVVGAVAKGGLAVYVAGSGSVPDGAALTNGEPFTGQVVAPPAATTPDAPFPSFDPATRTLTYQHALGSSELEINRLGGSYQPYAPVQVDDSSHNAGEWKARVKAYVAGNRNASGSADSPAIAAKATVNQLPVANAGDDLTITAPTSSVALMGAASDPDAGDTLTYLWRPITGPNTPLGLPATTLNAVVSNLIAGTYQFGFQATDQKGGKSQEDFVVVTVKPQPTTTPGGWDGRPILIICDGDSTTQGVIDSSGPVDPALAYPSRLQVALGSNFVVKNLGVGGTDTKQMLDRAPTTVDTLYDPATYYATYFYLHGGINNYLITHSPDYTVEQTLLELRQNLQGRQAKGIRSVACIVIPSNQPFEGSMQAINAAMRAQYTSWGIEGLCDFRKTPGYETYNGTSVGSFSDGVHRNDLGYQLMARDVRDSIKALVTPLGVPVPNYLFPFEGGTTTPAPGAETITIASVDVIADYITIASVTVL